MMTRINDSEKLLYAALERLEEYIEKEKYRGWDPYDALKSPLFRLPIFKTNKFIRFGIQQLVKRSPVNLRPLLLIPKGCNPVTLGLVLQAYSYKVTDKDMPDNVRSEIKIKIEYLLDELKKLKADNYSGACWGYDFDWEARHARIPAYKPTVVATGIISNALYICFKITGNNDAKEMLLSAANFILKDLNRSEEGETICFSYSPFDTQKVYNASMKGCRLLAQAFSITGNEEYKMIAGKAAAYVIKRQNSDGSWYYSTAQSGKYIDNYHTGYVLDCLDEYIKCTNDEEYREKLEKGYTYYRENFFEKDGIPKFYNSEKYPSDCTAAAQAILTLCRFGDIEGAKKTAKYMIQTMQNAEGYFYFRQFKNYKIETSFMRWSNAWMFAALSYLVSKRMN